MSDGELEYLASIKMIIAKEGVKHDQKKLPIHLFPWDVVFPISEVLAFGAKKYGDRNWEKGMDWDRLYRALMGHMVDWFQQIDKGNGPGNDEETGRNSLHHAACCMVFLVAYSQRKIGNDNRPGHLSE